MKKAMCLLKKVFQTLLHWVWFLHQPLKPLLWKNWVKRISQSLSRCVSFLCPCLHSNRPLALFIAEYMPHLRYPWRASHMFVLIAWVYLLWILVCRECFYAKQLLRTLRKMKSGGLTVVTKATAVKSFLKLMENLGASSVTETSQFHRRGI